MTSTGRVGQQISDWISQTPHNQQIIPSVPPSTALPAGSSTGLGQVGKRRQKNRKIPALERRKLSWLGRPQRAVIFNQPIKCTQAKHCICPPIHPHTHTDHALDLALCCLYLCINTHSVYTHTDHALDLSVYLSIYVNTFCVAHTHWVYTYIFCVLGHAHMHTHTNTPRT